MFTSSFLLGLLLLYADTCQANDPVVESSRLSNRIGQDPVATKSDETILEKKEESIQLEGISSKRLMKLLAATEKHAFKSEINRIMQLIINSLYTNSEIFLRELISNASDALDKLRFLSLTNPNALDKNNELNIHIRVDPDNRMLHISDTGIGMTQQHLIDYLGTIAKSATAEFVQRLEQAQESDQSINDLIGQFGVGFYSSFLVANKVIVTSKNDADQQYIWESNSTLFSVFPDPRGDTLGRGTTVSLHLKEEVGQYLQIPYLEELVHKYSQFIDFNVYLWKPKAVVEEVRTGENPQTKLKSDIIWEWVWINQHKPIWQRKPSEVTKEEYTAFYKTLSKDQHEPLGYNHFCVEGVVNFKCLLYVPQRASSNLRSGSQKRIDPIKLYVKRVFITDHFEEILPKYLSFIRGVIDTDDLPLNVARETLQQSKALDSIKQKLLRKSFDMLKRIPSDMYPIFWKEYGTHIKLGVMEDTGNRVHLVRLLRFRSSSSDDEFVSLVQYVERMKKEQQHIYFITARSVEEARKSPFAENVLDKGYEVFYLTDPIDQYCLQSLSDYQRRKFHNLANDHLELDTSRSDEQKRSLANIYQPLLTWFKETFNDSINDAKISDRLVRTPMALLASQYGHDGTMERLARVQTYKNAERDSITSYYFNQKKTLEINPDHPLIKDLLRRISNSQDDRNTLEFATVMLDAATLRSGYDLKDVTTFANRLESMLRQAMEIPFDEDHHSTFSSSSIVD